MATVGDPACSPVEEDNGPKKAPAMTKLKALGFKLHANGLCKDLTNREQIYSVPHQHKQKSATSTFLERDEESIIRDIWQASTSGHSIIPGDNTSKLLAPNPSNGSYFKREGSPQHSRYYIPKDLFKNGGGPKTGSEHNTSGASALVTSGATHNGGGVGTAARKRVQIVVDNPSDDLPPYEIQPNSTCKVRFSPRTWDTMMQSFRITLETDNVFICDHFLGHDHALGLFTELTRLKDAGHFERHMRTMPTCNYACLFLQGNDIFHKHIDALALMVYKLALYYTSCWNKISVELSYYPYGHKSQHFSKNEDTSRKLLKCLYFPDPDWEYRKGPEKDDGEEDGRRHDVHGVFRVKTGCKETKVEPAFDRLVVFWGDNHDHSLAECPREKYGVTVWLQR